MSDEKSLETLKVVLEGDANPLKKEMDRIRKKMNAYTREIRQQQDAIKKSMDETMDPVRKVREGIKKMISSVRMAANIKTPGNQFKNLEREADSAEKKLKKLYETRLRMEDAGSDIEYTQEYRDIAKSISEAEKNLNRLIGRQDKMRAMGVKESSHQWKSLVYDIQEADNTLKAAKIDMDNLSVGEKFKNTDKWKNLNREISETKMRLAQATAAKEEFASSHTVTKSQKKFEIFSKGLKTVSQSIKRTSGLFASLIQRFKTGLPLFNKTSSSMNRIGMSGKGLGGIFQAIGMSARFMFASFLIRVPIEGAKDGIKNLVQYSDKLNKSISVLCSDMITLKNAFAAAFSPIINVVTPYLDKYIGYVINAANATSQFFAALTGSSTWTKAIRVQADYAGSLDTTTSAAEKAKRSLMGFDQINALTDAKESTNSVPSIDDMFSTETVTNQFSDWVNKVKEAWQNTDFTDIGETVGTKISNVLNGIDWGNYYDKAGRFGSSVATFINGLLSVDSLWTGVGSTIAGGINTGIAAIKSFGENLHFGKLGEAIGKVINSTIVGIHWKDALSSATTWGTGIATALNSFLHETDFNEVGKGVANMIKTAVNSGYSFITMFDFSQLGTKISDSFNGFLQRMNVVDDASGLTGFQKLGVSIGKSMSGFADTIVTALQGIDKGELRKGVQNFLSSVFQNLDINVGKVALTIGGFTLAKVGFSLAFGAVKKALISKLSAVLAGGAVAGTVGSASAGGAAGLAGLSMYIPQVALVLGLGAISFAAGYNIAKFVDESGIVEEIKKVFTENTGKTTGWLDMWLSGMGTSTSDIKKGLKKKLKNIKKVFNKLIAKEDFKQMVVNIKNDAYTWWSNAKTWWADKVGEVKSFKTNVRDDAESWWQKAQDLWSGVVGMVDEFVTNVKNDASNWWNNTKAWWSTKVGNVQEFATNVKNEAADWWDNTKSWWSTKVGTVDEFTTDVKNDANNWWNNAVGFWNSVPDKIVSFGAKIAATGTDLWKNVTDAWAAVQNNEVVANVKAKLSSGWDTVKTVINGLKKQAKTKTYEFKAKATGAWTKLKGYVSSVVNKIKGKTATFTAKASGAWDNLKIRAKNLYDYVKDKSATYTAKTVGKWSTIANDAKTLYESMKSKTATFRAVASGAWDKISSTVSNIKSYVQNKVFTWELKLKQIKLPKISVSWAYKTIGTSKIKYPTFGLNWSYYASGGFPNNGQMFVANESGPELVGKMGNKTTVANQQQITEGIANGVYEAVVNAMSSLNGNSNSGEMYNEITIVVDSEKVFKLVQKGQKSHNRRYKTVVPVT